MLDTSAHLPETIPCPWGGVPLRLRWSFPTLRGRTKTRPFGVYWSRQFDHGFLSPSPTTAELNALYEVPAYEDYLSGRGAPAPVVRNSFYEKALFKFAYLADRSSNHVAEIILATSRNPTICDIGCGSGRFLTLMQERGAIVTGVDPSAVSQDANKRAGHEFFLGTAEQLPEAISGRQFDVVTMFQSLEHCRDPMKALSNARRLVRPGGLLVVDVPNMDCLSARIYRQAWWHTDAGRHLQFFTPKSLAHCCAQAGFRVIKCEYEGFMLQFSADWIREMNRLWHEIDLTGREPSVRLSSCYLPIALISPPSLKYDVVRIFSR